MKTRCLDLQNANIHWWQVVERLHWYIEDKDMVKHFTNNINLFTKLIVSVGEF